MRHPIIRHTDRPAYSFGGIINAIEEAQNRGLKRITMRFQDFIVKPSKYAGKMYVFSHGNIYLGWITATETNLGEIDLIKRVQSVAADPYAAAKLYGQNTGSCSCCGRELTNSLSIELGIGPICREKFGL